MTLALDIMKILFLRFTTIKILALLKYFIKKRKKKMMEENCINLYEIKEENNYDFYYLIIIFVIYINKSKSLE